MTIERQKRPEINVREIYRGYESRLRIEVLTAVTFVQQEVAYYGLTSQKNAIAFTGTRSPQRDNTKKLAAIFQILQEFGYTKLHHGDCIGGDRQAHDAAIQCGLNVTVRPPEKTLFRAFTNHGPPRTQQVQLKGARSYMERNQNIVDASNILIAIPKGSVSKEELRSGTWSTVRYARKKRLPIIFV